MFHIHNHNTLSHILREVSKAILAKYEDEVFDFLRTPEKWKDNANDLSFRWNSIMLVVLWMVNVTNKCPKKSGSVWQNFKGFYSLVLLELVDGGYNFIWAHVGANWSASDAVERKH